METPWSCNSGRHVQQPGYKHRFKKLSDCNPSRVNIHPLDCQRTPVKLPRNGRNGGFKRLPKKTHDSPLSSRWFHVEGASNGPSSTLEFPNRMDPPKGRWTTIVYSFCRIVGSCSSVVGLIGCYYPNSDLFIIIHPHPSPIFIVYQGTILRCRRIYHIIPPFLPPGTAHGNQE